MMAVRETVLLGALAVLALAIVVSGIRVGRGPTIADRVLALDLTANAGAGLMAVGGIAFDDPVFLDVSLILIVTGFVGTAAFAQLIERGARP
jgi:multicomponent Na+:H+ antiporter subunit F